MGTPSPSTPHPSSAGRGHGGRRPGAGAPNGNLNALKHGRYSLRYRAIARAMLAMPEVSAIMLRLARTRARDPARAQAIDEATRRHARQLKNPRKRVNQERPRRSNLGQNL